MSLKELGVMRNKFATNLEIIFHSAKNVVRFLIYHSQLKLNVQLKSTPYNSKKNNFFS